MLCNVIISNEQKPEYVLYLSYVFLSFRDVCHTTASDHTSTRFNRLFV